MGADSARTGMEEFSRNTPTRFRRNQYVLRRVSELRRAEPSEHAIRMASVVQTCRFPEGGEQVIPRQVYSNSHPTTHTESLHARQSVRAGQSF